MTDFSPAAAAAARHLIDLALAEDLGHTGDRTSDALIPADQPGKAAFVARSAGVVAGLPVVAVLAASFRPDLVLDVIVPDGTAVDPGTRLATIAGPLRTVLAAERIALNFLQRLSGVATLTRKYADAVTGTRAVVLDTRKTTPGWRILEKYAVRCGGGTNHRLGLYDGILIKDNHIAGLARTGDPATAVRRAVELARAFPGNAGLPVEVEVDTLEQLEQVLPASPDIVLLDNMTPEWLRTAVARRDAVSPGTKLEASGGVTLGTIRAVAETGVDRISVGALTHSAPALDIGLDYEG
jgi:nicotinate-nucleotide pyrophosphorylase (carboxylating)